MKKNILFIIPSLDVGGGEKSLVSLLNQMDYSKYNVDLFLIKKKVWKKNLSDYAMVQNAAYSLMQ